MKYILLVCALFWMAGCSEPTKPEQAAPAPAAASDVAASLLTVTPAATPESTKFNVQSDGTSAFSVNGNGFVRGASIMANGRKLPTIFGNAGWMTATMPDDLYEKPGVVTIKVANPSGKESNPVEFTVTPKKK
ncbi:MAG: hypothetical protein ABJF23_11125 [Bryobacteraceae bacterium]